MTIRKRLFVSNILMIVIPALLAVLVVAMALFLFFWTALPNTGHQLLSRHELEEARRELVEIATGWLCETELNAKAERANELMQESVQNQMTLVVEQGGTLIAQFGDESVPDRQQLFGRWRRSATLEPCRMATSICLENRSWPMAKPTKSAF